MPVRKGKNEWKDSFSGSADSLSLLETLWTQVRKWCCNSCGGSSVLLYPIPGLWNPTNTHRLTPRMTQQDWLRQVGYLGSGLLFATLLVIQISPAACAIFLPELAPYLHAVTWLNRLKDTSSIQQCSSMIAWFEQTDSNQAKDSEQTHYSSTQWL